MNDWLRVCCLFGGLFVCLCVCFVDCLFGGLFVCLIGCVVVCLCVCVFSLGVCVCVCVCLFDCVLLVVDVDAVVAGVVCCGWWRCQW